MLNQQGNRNPVFCRFYFIASLLQIKQHRNKELLEFKRRFQTAVEVLEIIGVMFGGCLVEIYDGILQEDYKKTRLGASDDEANRAETEAFGKRMAEEFIHSADKATFRKLPLILIICS